MWKIRAAGALLTVLILALAGGLALHAGRTGNPEGATFDASQVPTSRSTSGLGGSGEGPGSAEGLADLGDAVGVEGGAQVGEAEGVHADLPATTPRAIWREVAALMNLDPDAYEMPPVFVDPENGCALTSAACVRKFAHAFALSLYQQAYGAKHGKAVREQVASGVAGTVADRFVDGALPPEAGGDGVEDASGGSSGGKSAFAEATGERVPMGEPANGAPVVDADPEVAPPASGWTASTQETSEEPGALAGSFPVGGAAQTVASYYPPRPFDHDGLWEKVATAMGLDWRDYQEPGLIYANDTEEFLAFCRAPHADGRSAHACRLAYADGSNTIVIRKSVALDEQPDAEFKSVLSYMYAFALDRQARGATHTVEDSTRIAAAIRSATGEQVDIDKAALCWAYAMSYREGDSTRREWERLTDRIVGSGRKLPTFRSRNDHVTLARLTQNRCDDVAKRLRQ